MGLIKSGDRLFPFKAGGIDDTPYTSFLYPVPYLRGSPTGQDSGQLPQETELHEISHPVHCFCRRCFSGRLAELNQQVGASSRAGGGEQS